MPNDSDFKADIIARTASQWIAWNPHLNKNDLGIETDTGKMKVGIGQRYNATPYLPKAGGLTETISFTDIDQVVHTVTIEDGVIISWVGP